jgi:hypothetical protein
VIEFANFFNDRPISRRPLAPKRTHAERQPYLAAPSPPALPFAVPQSRWSDAEAATRSPAELLLYRSNLLGSDLTVTNFGGGNTSAKLDEVDPLTGETVRVLWVKGSGGDIGSMQLDGFSTLYLTRLLGLERLYRGVEFEDEMVGYLPHCTFNLNSRAASIDTPLHGYLPFAHVDHVHPDAIIALAARGGRRGRHARDLAGTGRLAAVEASGLRPRAAVARLRPAQPGTPRRHAGRPRHHLLGRDGARLLREHDRLDRRRGALSQRAPRAWTGFRRTDRRTPGTRGASRGGRAPHAATAGPDDRRARQDGPLLGRPAALEFVGSRDFERLAALGTSCPDHFLRTKIAPLTLDAGRLDDDAYLAGRLDAYRQGYEAYYRRCAIAGDPPMRDPNPVVMLVPASGG